MDVLESSQYPTKKFDIAIDKGTYDAIALCPTNSKEKRYKYKEFLSRILKPQSLFIITSCNWTSVELVEFFTKNNGNKIKQKIILEKFYLFIFFSQKKNKNLNFMTKLNRHQISLTEASQDQRQFKLFLNLLNKKKVV